MLAARGAFLLSSLEQRRIAAGDAWLVSATSRAAFACVEIQLVTVIWPWIFVHHQQTLH
jgi:hypothetical protein